MGGNSNTRTEMWFPSLLLPVLLLELLLASSVIGAVAATSSSTTTSYLNINNGTLLIRDKPGLVLPLLAQNYINPNVGLAPNRPALGPNQPGESYTQARCGKYHNPGCH
jgi:hypothetical protein